MEEFDVAIIGAGIVGLGTAVYAGRFNMSTAVFGELVGGTITLTDVVENYPGFASITGFDLAMKVKEHAEQYNIAMKGEKVINIEKIDEKFIITTTEGKYMSKAVIYCTGTEWRKLNIPGEKELANKGVHYCALCDGAFYKDKVVAVIGGSDSAAKDALVLTQWAKKVYIIYRKEKIRPEPVNYDRVIANKKIEIIYTTNLLKINGKDSVESITLNKPYNGSEVLPMDAVFVAVGHIALSQLAVKLGVKVDSHGEIMINRESKTNIPGFFAAGDVVDSKFKQAITGVGEGVNAAYSAYMYISK